MLDVVPPGMHPMRIKPMAMAGGRPKAWASRNPSAGMMPYWQTRPTITPLGLRKAIKKSRQVSDAPIPSMMTIIITPSSLVSNSVTIDRLLWPQRPAPD